MTPDQIKDEARFAQLVSTPNGPGILIAGHVFEVRVPDNTTPVWTTAGGYLPSEYVGALVAALRQGGHDQGEAS